MIIERTLLFEGSKKGLNLMALFDSGATFSSIQQEYAIELGGMEPILHPFEVETAKKAETMLIKKAVRLDFYIDDYRFSDEFMIIPDLAEQVIIGAKTLQSWKIKLDFEHDKLILDPRVKRVRLI